MIAGVVPVVRKLSDPFGSVGENEGSATVNLNKNFR